jgi:dTDP-4-amino-4,6-dideoxygalactose transaminase
MPNWKASSNRSMPHALLERVAVLEVSFYRHSLGSDDVASVAAVLQSPFLTTGKVARAVEVQLTEYFDLPHALLVNSWTNGALALLLALELKPGDEVIVPAMTFIATANVVELAGGTPVFVDVDPATMLMTPQGVRQALTERTRAVVPVHLYGQMCDIARMRQVLDSYRSGILLIEDCAHCFEGEFNGEKPGRHSDAAIFSFYATKNVTCGEGGAILLSDKGLFDAVVETRLHGMTAIAADRFAGGRYNHWDMKRLGTKANLPDLLAAYLPSQIRSVDARLVERHRLAQRYRAAFADGPLRLIEQWQHVKSAEHLFVIGVSAQNRDAAIHALNSAGIGVTVNYRSVPDSTYYHNRYPEAGNSCPVSRSWGEETISLPLFPGLTDAEQDYVIGVVREEVYPLVLSERTLR